MGKRDFTRFRSKKGFRRISYIAPASRVLMGSEQHCGLETRRNPGQQLYDGRILLANAPDDNCQASRGKSPLIVFIYCINSEILLLTLWDKLCISSNILTLQVPGPVYSISQEICKRFCCALLCCGYTIVHNEFTWRIYPYSSGLLCWHWGNR